MLEQLTQQDGAEAYRWIETQLQAPPVGEPHRVNACLPDLFERYVKVLNPFRLPVGMTLQESLATLSAELTQQEALKPVLDQHPIFEPISFHRVRQAVGVPLFPEVNFESIYASFRNRFPVGLFAPAEDTLSAATCRTLTTLLAPFTAGRVYFHFWILAFDWDQDGFFTGQLADVAEFLGMNQGLTPTTWWPEERSWCLTTPYDLTFSLIGGPSVLIDQLLGHPDLSCAEVQPSTRVDDRAGLLGAEE